MKRSLWLRCSPLLRLNWPNSAQGETQNARVSAVVVNFNTCENLCWLLFSLYRVLGRDRIQDLVVVDNVSTDGSRELLIAMAKASLATPILNERQYYHGPGLNQGMDYLAAKYRRRENCPAPHYVLILDSDVIILRNFMDLALKLMEKEKAALCGDIEPFEHLPGGYIHPSTMLFDPAQCWRRGLHKFEHHGVPAMEFQRSLMVSQRKRVHFPFQKEHWVIHLGGATLKQIKENGVEGNDFYDWSKQWGELAFLNDARKVELFQKFHQVFSVEMGQYTPEKLAEVCLNFEKPSDFLPLVQSTQPG